MSDKLRGQIALVTGSSRGIGLAIAKAFVEEGAKVIISSRKPDNVAVAAAEINESTPNAAIPLPLHIGKIDEHEAFLEKVIKTIGLPSILVNNAAANPYSGPLIDIPWSAWHKTLEVNLHGPFGLTKHLAQRLISQQKTGSIINISSIFGIGAAPMQGIYGMTKAALISMTQTLSHELGPHGIRVNAIAPGLVDTRFAGALLNNPKTAKIYNKRCALGRPGQPHEIAGMAVYLADPQNAYTTGQCFTVDGGYSAI